MYLIRAYSKEIAILHTWPAETFKLLNLPNEQEVKYEIDNDSVKCWRMAVYQKNKYI